jgi:hypothetical protein
LAVLSALGLFNTLRSTGWAAAGLAALAIVFWMGARASVLFNWGQIPIIHLSSWWHSHGCDGLGKCCA